MAQPIREERDHKNKFQGARGVTIGGRRGGGGGGGGLKQCRARHDAARGCSDTTEKMRQNTRRPRKL